MLARLCFNMFRNKTKNDVKMKKKNVKVYSIKILKVYQKIKFSVKVMTFSCFEINK